jgi:hypothetical protein
VTLPIDPATGALSPAFIEALRKVVPKRRRLKARYVVGLGMLIVAVVLGADPSTRQFASTRWRRTPVVTTPETVATRPAKAPPSIIADDPTAALPAASFGAPAPPSTAGAPAKAEMPKKTRPRAVPRATRKP